MAGTRFDGKTPSRIIKNESREDYLESILLLSRLRKRTIRSYEIADHMGLSKPSVSRAMGILREQGLVSMDDDYYVTLTEAGTAEAERVYAKHCYFKELLQSVGVEEEIAENEACRIEHIISDDSFKKLKAALTVKPVVTE